MNITAQNPLLEELIIDVAEVAGYLWDRGWAERNAGNISVNITALISEESINLENQHFVEITTHYPELANLSFLVTGTGKRMRDLARKPLDNALLIRLNSDGSGYYILSREKNSKDIFLPTSEFPTHLGIHQMVKQRGSHETVVLHTHATELVALTQIKEYCDHDKLNNLLWGMHPETMVFVPEGIGFVPYVTPGTDDIAVESLKVLKKHPIVLWEKHGVFCIGDSILDTFDNIDIMAKSAKIFFLTRGAGYTPEGLTEKELDILKVIAANF
ncbi:MAG: rhamnulose-1-phosphate aldolase [Bacteroidales bacterium]|nr:rhamnulose-1-phosphate aldolase [Bacteroidales bacterium]